MSDPTSGRTPSRRAADATVPIEAFDDTHPDHAEWVKATGYRFCADDCSIHGEPERDRDAV